MNHDNVYGADTKDRMRTLIDRSGVCARPAGAAPIVVAPNFAICTPNRNRNKNNKRPRSSSDTGTPPRAARWSERSDQQSLREPDIREPQSPREPRRLREGGGRVNA